jgi:pimeloyl-ACP methyl ester carboxylesterase
MPTDAQNIAFVLVPGGFCPGSVFHKITAKLTNLGFSVQEISLPSVGKRDQGPATLYDDADHVNSVITKFADQGKSVIVVANSYGGVVATEASKDVGKTQREATGKSGGLVHHVFIGSLLAPVGMSLYEAVNGKAPVQTEADIAYIDRPDFEHGAALFCSDLGEAEQRFYQDQMECHSARSFSCPVTYAGYLHIPTTVVVPTNDKTLSTKKQIENVTGFIEKGVGSIKMVEIYSDHCAMISHADEIVDILLKAAKETN